MNTSIPFDNLSLSSAILHKVLHHELLIFDRLVECHRVELHKQSHSVVSLGLDALVCLCNRKTTHARIIRQLVKLVEVLDGNSILYFQIGRLRVLGYDMHFRLHYSLIWTRPDASQYMRSHDRIRDCPVLIVSISEGDDFAWN